MHKPSPSDPPPVPQRAKTIGKLPLIRSEPPDLVPARMINEALYCKRLMILEWAQGEFADNVYTVDGRVIHRRVDRVRGALPDPDEEPAPFTATSVWLSSERLGITAKIDYVESDGGAVVPVERKRGKSPEIPGGAYLPERAQVCAQVLLLREHGYTCERGEIYFAGDRRRVPIPIDERLIERTLDAAREARELAASGELPRPLEGSPKCVGCSLSSICLPDEVTLLRGLAGQPIEEPPEEPQQLGFGFEGDAWGPLPADPWGLVGEDAELEEAPAPIRRLVPARDDRIPLYVQAQGARIGLEGDRLRVAVGGAHVADARLPNTSHVAVFGNAQISTQALAALLDRDIPLVFFSGGGWLRGRTVGHGSKNADLRIAQYRAAVDDELACSLARSFVAAKIRNQRTLLRRNATRMDAVTLGELEALAKKSERVANVPSLLGLEGTAARVYFARFTTMLKGIAADEFDLDGRNRRPPRDPVNALLSFAYALLTKDVALAVVAAGLDPLIGFLHRPRYGRPALALDLVEEMRPLVADSTVITALNTGALDAGDFVRAATGCALTARGRKKMILAYERRVDQLVSHPVFGYRISYRRLFEVQARLLGRALLGEIPDYPAFRTR
ncbi:MAG: CRISPR-associated endonuclease Cas1 [Sandaracinaceae bacterium]|nr:CRISPR-associated endonuclease Cas1 [Sandaracinaceae bacterium]